MENLERQFEGQWQEAFRGAEAEPPVSLWLSIEASLANLENNSNKRRVVFYRRLAASLLLICTASFVTTYWAWKASPDEAILSQSSKPVTDSNNKASTPESNKIPSSQSSAEGSQIESSAPSGNKMESPSVVKNTRESKHLASTAKPLLASVPVVDSTQMSGEKNLAPNLSGLASQTTHDSSSMHIAQAGTEQPQPQKALTEEEEKALVKKLLGEEDDVVVKKKSVHQPSWISAGLAGGSYDPQPASGAVYGATFDALQSGSSVGTVRTSPRPPSKGSSYSVGLMVGKQLGSRWVLQTGLNYMVQRIDYESNVVLSSANSMKAIGADIAGLNSSTYSFTSPYTINSASEYVSLPLQIGYVFLDRKVGFTLHTGVSTDFFIRNELSDPSGNYGTYSQSGSDASFRSVSWAGMGSAELSYRLATHYRLSLVPGIRYSFTNIVKEETGTSNPLVFDVGLRFRYIFK